MRGRTFGSLVGSVMLMGVVSSTFAEMAVTARDAATFSTAVTLQARTPTPGAAATAVPSADVERFASMEASTIPLDPDANVPVIPLPPVLVPMLAGFAWVGRRVMGRRTLGAGR